MLPTHSRSSHVPRYARVAQSCFFKDRHESRCRTLMRTFARCPKRTTRHIGPRLDPVFKRGWSHTVVPFFCRFSNKVDASAPPCSPSCPAPLLIDWFHCSRAVTQGDPSFLLRRFRAYGAHFGRTLQLEGLLQQAHGRAMGARVHQAGGERFSLPFSRKGVPHTPTTKALICVQSSSRGVACQLVVDSLCPRLFLPSSLSCVPLLPPPPPAPALHSDAPIISAIKRVLPTPSPSPADLLIW